MSNQKHVLAVEDEKNLRLLISRLLSYLGYSVETVECGESAVALLKSEHNFDLLVTDLVMPYGMSGHELAARARKIAPNIKVLFTSGYPVWAFEDFGLGDKAEPNFLQKPYKLKELREAIENTLASTW